MKRENLSENWEDLADVYLSKHSFSEYLFKKYNTVFCRNMLLLYYTIS